MAEQRPDRPTPKRPRPGLPNGSMKFGRGLFGWVLFIALAIMLVYLISQKKADYANIPFGEFLKRVDSKQLQSLTVEGENLYGKFSSTANRHDEERSAANGLEIPDRCPRKAPPRAGNSSTGFRKHTRGGVAA